MRGALSSVRQIGIAALCVIVGVMWWQQSLWKIPPHYSPSRSANSTKALR